MNFNGAWSGRTKRADINDEVHALCNNSASNGDKSPLYFLVMAPYPDSVPFNPSWRGGPAVVPAAMVARDYVNNRSDILEDYTLNFIVYDSGCNIVSKATNNITQGLFYSDKNVVGIIGPGCSEAALAIAPLVTNSRTSLIQIAPTATSPLLTNSTLYPNTFRPIVSALGFINTFIELMKQKDYRHVGALYEAERSFLTAVYTHFETAVKEAERRVSSFGLFNTSIPINEFRRSNIRVIFVFTSNGFARTVLCLAFNQRMLYPDYQFIFINWRPSNFMTNVTFSLDGTKYSCSEEEMEQAAVGMVFCNFRLTRQDRDNVTDAGISYNQFSREYNETRDCHLKSLGLTSDSAIETEHHSGYFDATWALALSLNNSLPRLEERGLSLSNYTYQMPEVTQIVREELLKLDFEGMRGRVRFSEETLDGANVTVIDIYQVLSTAYDVVGVYDPLRAKPLTLYPNASFIPAEFDPVYLTPHISLGIIVVIAVTLLCLALLACQVAYIVWGQYKTVKAASPNLNHLIFSSCYLSLVGVVVYTSAFIFIDVSELEDSDVIIPVHCSALQWSSTTTYSLMFGTLCAKTWRIHRIFNGFSASPMKRLSDRILVSIALVPLAVDVIMNILWNLVDPWTFLISTEEGVGLLQAMITCTTNNEIVWTLCIAIPKVVLTVITLYLAVATRRVHRKEFRQTKSINILIFSLTALTGICVPTFIVLQYTIALWAVSVSYVSFVVFGMAMVVLCIVLVLLPPLIPPIKEKLLRRKKKKHLPEYPSPHVRRWNQLRHRNQC